MTKTYKNTSISHVDVISFKKLAEIAKESIPPLLWHDERAVINLSIILDIMTSIFESNDEITFDKSDVFDELHEGNMSTLDTLFDFVEENCEPHLIGMWYIESYLEEIAEESGYKVDGSVFPFNLLSWDHRAIENVYQIVDVNGEEYFFKKCSK